MYIYMHSLYIYILMCVCGWDDWSKAHKLCTMGESGSLCSPRELRPDSQPQPQLEESQGMRSALAFGGHNEGRFGCPKVVSPNGHFNWETYNKQWDVGVFHFQTNQFLSKLRNDVKWIGLHLPCWRWWTKSRLRLDMMLLLLLCCTLKWCVGLALALLCWNSYIECRERMHNAARSLLK